MEEEEEEEEEDVLTVKEVRTSGRRPLPSRTNSNNNAGGGGGGTFSHHSLVGTRKMKRKADFLATKAKTLKRKQKVKKTEGKYKIPSASKMETIEDKFREKMKQLANKIQEVDGSGSGVGAKDGCEGKGEGLVAGLGKVEEMECR